MEFPLFGFADMDMEIFPNIDAARAEIEPIDAKNSLWRVYDRLGQRLTIDIVQRPQFDIWPFSLVKVETVEFLETGELDRVNMQQAIKEYLAAVPSERFHRDKNWLETASLEELTEEAIRVCRQ
jgi:hypothetical protein